MQFQIQVRHVYLSNLWVSNSSIKKKIHFLNQFMFQDHQTQCIYLFILFSLSNTAYSINYVRTAPETWAGRGERQGMFLSANSHPSTTKKFSPCTPCRHTGDTAPFIHSFINLAPIWWLVSFTLRQLDPHNWTGGWVGPKVGMNVLEKDLFPLLRMESRFLGRPARSQFTVPHPKKRPVQYKQ
jgi:hypothetical protein